MTRPERKPWFSRSIAWDRFVCVRTGQEVAVTTVEFAEPVDYGGIYPATYQAETIIWVGPDLERLAEIKRYNSPKHALRCHAAIVRRAKR